MTTIIAFAGKKQSGKSTCCEAIENYFDGQYEIETFSFADQLKQLCINLFGLSIEQVYGTDAQKNTKTSYKWEDMPGAIADFELYEQLLQQGLWKTGGLDKYLTFHKPGYMTAREFLQFFGTEIGRKIYGNIWVNATINQILAIEPDIALIDDCRFPNEADGVLNEDGLVIRLNRSIYDDEHDSETALDPNNFDHNKFSYILDNSQLNIQEQSANVIRYVSDKLNLNLKPEILHAN